MRKRWWSVAMVVVAGLASVVSANTYTVEASNSGWVYGIEGQRDTTVQVDLRTGYAGGDLAGLLKFPAITVPEGQVFKSATLYMNYNLGDAGLPLQVFINTVVSPWDSSTTYNTLPAVDTRISGTTLPASPPTWTGGTSNWFTWDATAAVQKWISGSLNNRDLIVTSSAGPSYQDQAWLFGGTPYLVIETVPENIINVNASGSGWVYGMEGQRDTAVQADIRTGFAGGELVGLLKFPVITLPANKVVQTATLFMNYNLSDAGLPLQVFINTAVSPWDSSTTYNTLPAVDSRISGTTLPGLPPTWTGGTSNWFSWDATAAVKKWVAGTLNNRDLLVTSSAGPNYQNQDWLWGETPYLVIEMAPKTTILDTVASRVVRDQAGQTILAVNNLGNSGTMNWSAAVTTGGDWLSIVSGGSGTTDGTITVHFTENTNSASRTGTIRVTAPEATGSPRDITIVQSGPTTFSREWVRHQPFTLMALNQQSGSLVPSQYRGAGLNNLLAWWEGATQVGVANQSHLTWQVLTYYDSLSSAALDYIGSVAAAGGASRGGWLVFDEPTVDKMPGVAEVMNYLKQTYPDSLVYTNLLSQGTDEAYVDSAISIMAPDVLMYDFYPFRTTGSIDGDYFMYLMRYRTKAKAANIPYWSFIQAAAWSDYRFPSESDIRMNIFSTLAAGYTGIAYFLYDQAPSVTDQAILAEGNVPSPLYAPLAAANAEALQLGEQLKTLTSTDVRFIPGRTGGVANSTPAGLTNWTAGAGGDLNLVGIQVDAAADGADKNGLIGLFVDDAGSRYFMLTNLNHGADLSADQTSLSFQLQFCASISKLYRISRTTGQPEEVVLADHILTTTLPGGTGDLYYYATIIPGDANLDNKVDVSDLGILAANYGKTSGATWAQGDFNGDGKVDVSDLGILAANYGTGTGGSLDFNRDAKALGLVTGGDSSTTETAKDDASVTSTSGCGLAGLGLISGLVLMGLFLIKLEE